jgi:hypothetical protein
VCAELPLLDCFPFWPLPTAARIRWEAISVPCCRFASFARKPLLRLFGLAAVRCPTRFCTPHCRQTSFPHCCFIPHHHPTSPACVCTLSFCSPVTNPDVLLLRHSCVRAGCSNPCRCFTAVPPLNCCGCALSLPPVAPPSPVCSSCCRCRLVCCCRSTVASMLARLCITKAHPSLTYSTALVGPCPRFALITGGGAPRHHLRHQAGHACCAAASVRQLCLPSSLSSLIALLVAPVPPAELRGRVVIDAPSFFPHCRSLHA